MSFKDRLAFFQNAVSQQNSNVPSYQRSGSTNAQSSNHPPVRGPQNRLEGFNQQTRNVTPSNQNYSEKITQSRTIQQNKETPKTKIEEVKKEDPKPAPTSNNGGGFASKMAFFQNQVNNRSTSYYKPPSKEVPKPEPKKEIPKPEPKKEIPKPEPKKEVPKPEPKKEIPKPEPKKEMPKPEPKIEIPKPEPEKEISKPELTKETPKPNATSNKSGFAAKMAFFQNQVNNRSTSYYKPPPSKEVPKYKPKIESTNSPETKPNIEQPKLKTESTNNPETKSNVEQTKPRNRIAERLAMFNNQVPMGKPVERGQKGYGAGGGYLVNPSEIAGRAKRSQTLAPPPKPTMGKDSVAITMAKDDSNIETPPQGMPVRRQVRGATTRRRPTLIPDL